VEVVALGDYGADFSAICTDMLAKIVNAGNYVEAARLPDPIRLAACVMSTTMGPVEITAESIIRCNIVLNLPCGPLRLRRVEFLIIDQEMDEVLLGRPLQASLGFDLTSHLEKVFDSIDNMDTSAEALGDGFMPKIASLSSYAGLRYDITDDDPVPSLCSAGKDMADVDIAEIKEACGTMLDESKAAGVSEYGHERLRQMVGTYPDIFRVRMGLDPPADIPPMVITLKDNARPVVATQRRYSQPQVAFINAKVKELVTVGALFINPISKWASPIVAAPKPGSTEGFRFTVDLRAPNAQTIPMASAMPNLEAMLQAVEGSSYYAR
jgi:hypothetical protein